MSPIADLLEHLERLRLLRPGGDAGDARRPRTASAFEIEVTAAHLQAYGTAHGGVLAGLLDAAMGLAVLAPPAPRPRLRDRRDEAELRRPGARRAARPRPGGCCTRGAACWWPPPRRTTPDGGMVACAQGTFQAFPTGGADVSDATRLDGRVAVVTGGAGGIGHAIGDPAGRARRARRAHRPRPPLRGGGAGDRVGGVRRWSTTSPTRGAAAHGRRRGAGPPRAPGHLGQRRRLGPAGPVRRHATRSAGSRSSASTTSVCWPGCRAALPGLRTAPGGGAIVSISSDTARVGGWGEAVYAGAKAGVVAFSKSLAREVARDGIRVNCVSPAVTRDRLRGAPARRSRRRAHRRGRHPGDADAPGGAPRGGRRGGRLPRLAGGLVRHRPGALGQRGRRDVSAGRRRRTHLRVTRAARRGFPGWIDRHPA